MKKFPNVMPINDTELLTRIKESLEDADEIPRRILTAQIPLLGLEPSSSLYQETIYYYDNPGRRKDLASKQSGCGLFTEYGWLAAGVTDNRLKIPVDTRSSEGGLLYPITLEIDIAEKMGAIRWKDGDSQESFDPQQGDALIIGCKSCPGIWAKNTYTVEHEFTIALVDLSYAAASFMTIHSFDGGQPGIAVRTRSVVFGPGNEVWLANTDENGFYEIDSDRRPVKGRRVLKCINVTKLQCINTPNGLL